MGCGASVQAIDDAGKRPAPGTGPVNSGGDGLKKGANAAAAAAAAAPLLPHDLAGATPPAAAVPGGTLHAAAPGQVPQRQAGDAGSKVHGATDGLLQLQLLQDQQQHGSGGAQPEPGGHNGTAASGASGLPQLKTTAPPASASAAANGDAGGCGGVPGPSRPRASGEGGASPPESPWTRANTTLMPAGAWDDLEQPQQQAAHQCGAGGGLVALGAAGAGRQHAANLRYKQQRPQQQGSDLGPHSSCSSSSSLPSEEDDPDGQPGFSLSAWKRFYHWNHRKHSDLLEYLWGRWDASSSQRYSLWCVHFLPCRHLLAAYMAENLANGMAARLEDAAETSSLFGLLHVLYDYDLDEYRLLGLFVFEGQEVPPCLAAAPDAPCYEWHRAEPLRDTAAKQLVSALLTSKTPVGNFSVMFTRQVA